MKPRGRRRQDYGAAKHGYRKGCFGGATLAARQRARELRHQALSYARRYVNGRMAKSPHFSVAMKDKIKYQMEVERVAKRRMKSVRAKAAEKRTARAQKV